jgi:plastocyanin
VQNCSTRPRTVGAAGIFAILLLVPFLTPAQEQPVTAQIKIQRPAPAKAEKTPDSSEVVIWLTPADRTPPVPSQPGKKPQVVQKNKAFHPHLTVVRVGSVVDFPNRDPFFHNVFSLFDGKRFDLGLYEAGATNSVRFDHPGVSFLFCNIHPEMSAVVVAVDTPYYAISDKNGSVSIPSVPDGKYELHVWYERSLPDALKGLTRTVHISGDSHDLGPIVVPQDPGFSTAHKNKYGQDYAPPPTPSYQH